MSTPPLPEGLDSTRVNRVANELHSAAIHLLRHARVADRQTGLSPERLSILSVLVFTGPQTLSRLARIEQVSRPAISRSVGALVEEGLVRRVRSQQDRRAVTAHATARGQSLMEAGRSGRIQRISSALAGLTAAELRTLREAADILHRTADRDRAAS